MLSMIIHLKMHTWLTAWIYFRIIFLPFFQLLKKRGNSPHHWKCSGTLPPSRRRRRGTLWWWWPGYGHSPGNLSPLAWHPGVSPGRCACDEPKIWWAERGLVDSWLSLLNIKKGTWETCVPECTIISIDARKFIYTIIIVMNWRIDNTIIAM